MNEEIEIKGGAGEFEAAVIAVVLDRIAREAESARQPQTGTALSAWMTAGDDDGEMTPPPSRPRR